MTPSSERRFQRTELAHGADHVLVPSATFADAAGSSFTGRFTTEDALRAFLDLALSYKIATGPVRLFLRPEGYTPAPNGPPEFLPSALYFDVDRERGVAAAALLVIDGAGQSHQWLTQGDLGRDDLALVMDEFNPHVARFPQESFIAMSSIGDAVRQWAFGDVLPPPAVRWRTASEDEVGWPVGAGY